MVSVISTFENSRDVEVSVGDEHEHGLSRAPGALRAGYSLASAWWLVRGFCRYPATFHVSGIPETWEVIACELNEMLSKDGLSWNQELAYPKRFVPFGYAQATPRSD